MSSSSSSSSQFISFLFSVHDLIVDGESEQNFVGEQWVPPTKCDNIQASNHQVFYHWRDGVISRYAAPSFHGHQWLAQDGKALILHRARSVFWCGKLLRFVTAPGDASIQDVSSHDAPTNQWMPLQFCSDRHDPGLSRLEDVGEPTLFGTKAPWIVPLGLGSYDDPPPHEVAPAATGLGGNLATVIAILAFSCQADKLESVLTTEEAWRGGVWREHSQETGRIKERGIVVNVFYDPGNQHGSNHNTLHNLETGRGQILVRSA